MMGQDFNIFFTLLLLADMAVVLIVLIEAWFVLRLVRRWLQVGLGLKKRLF